MTVTQYIHNLFQTYNNYPLCAPYIFSINHTPSITISQSYDKRNIFILLYSIIHTLIHSIIHEIINMQRTGWWLRNLANGLFEIQLYWLVFIFKSIIVLTEHSSIHHLHLYCDCKVCEGQINRIRDERQIVVVSFFQNGVSCCEYLFEDNQ